MNLPVGDVARRVARTENSVAVTLNKIRSRLADCVEDVTRKRPRPPAGHKAALANIGGHNQLAGEERRHLSQPVRLLECARAHDDAMRPMSK